MSRLLISVRNAHESQQALVGGADLIDIKEPSRGSLGQADASVVREIATLVGTRRPLSAALGELRDTGFDPPSADLRFAKWGLSGCLGLESWPALLAVQAKAVQQTNPHCQVVGVAYADWRRAQAPSPSEVCLATAEVGGSVVLLDTYKKDGSTLLDWLEPYQLHEISVRCRERGLQLALAGGIDFDSLPAILEIEPDWIAIRGAACIDGREGMLCSARVTSLARAIHGFKPKDKSLAS